MRTAYKADKAFQAALVTQFGKRAVDARHGFLLQMQYSEATHLAAAAFHHACAQESTHPFAVRDHKTRAKWHETEAKSNDCPHCFGDHDGCTRATPRCAASKGGAS